MRKFFVATTLTFFILFVVQSCKYPIEYTQITGQKYLTVDATLSNQAGPYRTILSYSSEKIDGTGYVNYISKAKVYVIDENQVRTDFSESTNGTYVTDPNFKARAGGTYILHIETPDGKVYVSNPETIGTSIPVMDSVYYNSGQVLVNFKDSPKPNEYYQWTWVHYQPISICEVCTGLVWSDFYNRCIARNGVTGSDVFKYPCDSKCWDFYSGKSISIFSDKLYNGKQINGLPIANLVAYDKYYLQLDSYYISEDYYNYLRAIKTETEDNGTLFDVPTLTKFNFNISCVNDPTAKVLGIFRAVSTVRKILYLKGVGHPIEYVDPNAQFENPMVTSPCQESGSRTKIPPEGWQD